MSRGCHSLSQLGYLLPDADFSVERSTIQWQGRLDIDVDALIRASMDGDTVDIEYRMSFIENLRRRTRLVFDGAVIEFNQCDPGDSLDVTLDVTDTNTINFEHSDRFPTTWHQTFSFRWLEFLTAITTADGPESLLTTLPGVTELLVDLYETAGRPHGGSQ